MPNETLMPINNIIKIKTGGPILLPKSFSGVIDHNVTGCSDKFGVFRPVYF